MKRLFVLMLACIITLSLCACNSSVSSNTPSSSAAGSAAAGGETYTLKLSTSQNESSPICQGFFDLADAVKEASNGRLIIEVYPSSQLGNDEDVIEQAIQGSNITVLTDAGRMGNYVSDMGILLAPYFADSYDECLAITQTDTFAEWEKELVEQDGIRLLCFDFYDGPRHFLTNKEVKTPSDLNGLRIRTMGSKVCTTSITDLGATPVAMAWSETYSGIQSKALDGCEVQNTSSYTSRTYEVTKYLNKTGHFQLLNGLMCGEKWFQSLPADLQTILVETCKKVGAENAQKVISVTDDYEQKMISEGGMKLVEPDLDQFKAAADKAYEELGFTELRQKLYDEIGKK